DFHVTGVQTCALPICRLGALPRLAVKAPVVDPDRQTEVVDLPKLLKDQFGEAAGIAEDDRGAVPRDLRHHLMHRIAPRMPGPGSTEERRVGKEIRRAE